MTAVTCVKCGALDVHLTSIAVHAAPVVFVAQCKICQHGWRIDGDTAASRDTLKFDGRKASQEPPR